MAALNESLAYPLPVLGIYLSSNLPSANSVPVGTPATTSDLGTLYSNGTTWQNTPILLFPVSATGTSYTPPFTGGVATTVSAKLAQTVSVVDFGADPTGAADSTAAILAASQSDTRVIFPTGTYKVTNLVITGKTNMTWIGAGVGGITITTATAGVMVTFASGNFCIIDGFNFLPTGTLAASTGLLFQTNHNNSIVRNCLFQLWTNAGHRCLGTSGSPLSGNKVYDCLFLQCASGASGFGQLDASFSNDYFVTHNQFGTINTGTFGFPNFGMRADNCSNGQTDSNFFWTNLQAAQFTTCKYDRVFSNRFEQTQQAGAIFTSCINTIFTANWLNNNGNQTTNTYNDLRWITCNRVVMTANMFYNWNGAAPNTKFACSLETNSAQFTIKGNTANPAPSGYATAAWSWDSTIPNTGMTTDGAMNFTSGATIAVGTSAFIGWNTSNASSSVTARFLESTHTIVQMVVEPGNAPGAGQSFTYTLYKGGVATALVVTLSGASAFQGSANATTTIEDIANNSSYTVLVVTSAGANVTNHYAQVMFCGK